MANTEGMSDEGVASLLSSSAIDANVRKKGQSAFKRRQLERRMMEGGLRPAATVKRYSARKEQATKTASSTDLNDDIVENKGLNLPEVGSIVERQVKNQPLSKQTQRDSPVTPLGTPSLNFPVGTFVKAKSKQKHQDTKGKTANSGSTRMDSDISNMMDASRREADSMLAEMSLQEIRETKNELNATLSPETISFLRKRKQKSAGRESKSKIGQSAWQDPTVQTVESQTQRSAQSQIVESSEESLIHTPASELNREDDFLMACDLLRSTSTQQVQWAARRVFHSLVRENRVTYPLILPVSLRCILDTPGRGQSILLMHSHILRSLYALLLITAPKEHIVQVSEVNDVETFSTYFMDDAILTPSLHDLYSSRNEGQPIKMGKETVAYTTSSSNVSAQADGAAFREDPMWTLLARMRILPRISQLLEYDLAEEALVAVCGILAMLAVRSPGAASAIANHSLFISLLLKTEVLPGESYSFCSPGICVPALLLLNTLARQSRAVAAAIPSEVLPHLVVLQPTNDQEQRVQQLALILWRILLRYGLAGSHLPSFVSLSVPHLSRCLMGHSVRYFNAAEYLSALSVVCENLAVANKQKLTTGALEPFIDTTWLTSIVGQCIYLVTVPKQSLDNEDLANELKIYTACMKLVLSGLRLGESVQATESEQGNDKRTFFVKEASIAVAAIWKNEVVQKALKVVFNALSGRSQGDSTTIILQVEASSSALVEVTLKLLREHEAHLLKVTDDDSNAATVLLEIRELLLSGLTADPHGLRDSYSLSRAGWLNRVNFAACEYLLETASPEQRQRELSSLRFLSFSLLATLLHGQEYMADYLFRHSFLFQPGVVFDEKPKISAMFQRELRGNEFAQKQLIHSYRLHQRRGGLDATSALELETLLSTADSQGLGNFVASDSLPLPLGELWLWNVLSGTVTQSSASRGAAAWEDVAELVLECLSMLVEVERTSFSMLVPSGAKMYHLFNVCLYPESVMRTEGISKLVSELFQCYLQNDLGLALTKDFQDACFEHSQTVKTPGKNDENEEDEKKLALLLNESGAARIAALENFAEDMCNSYLMFGAQYDAFTQCVRFLLSAGFPPKARRETINLLRPVLHLLTLSEESDESLESALQWTLSGGLPDRDGSERESPLVLDTVASVMKESKSDSSLWMSHARFFMLFSCAILARSLADGIKRESSLEATKRRLMDIPNPVFDAVTETAKRLISSERGDKSDLVKSAMDVCIRKQGFSLDDASLVDELAWEEAVRTLKLPMSILWKTQPPTVEDDVVRPN